MKYRVVVFGVKDTSENIIQFIREEICPVDLVITISPEVTKKNQVSGGADCRQRLGSEKFSHDQRVRSIVKLLKHLTQKNRQCKSQYQAIGVSCRHVFYIVLHMVFTSSFCI